MAKKSIKYSEAIAQIEAILTKFKSNEVDVDSLASEVKRATELINECRARLNQAEEDLKSLKNS